MSTVMEELLLLDPNQSTTHNHYRSPTPTLAKPHIETRACKTTTSLHLNGWLSCPFRTTPCWAIDKVNPNAPATLHGSTVAHHLALLPESPWCLINHRLRIPSLAIQLYNFTAVYTTRPVVDSALYTLLRGSVCRLSRNIGGPYRRCCQGRARAGTRGPARYRGTSTLPSSR